MPENTGGHCFLVKQDDDQVRRVSIRMKRTVNNSVHFAKVPCNKKDRIETYVESFRRKSQPITSKIVRHREYEGY
jgi:hypothetical protein